MAAKTQTAEDRQTITLHELVEAARRGREDVLPTLQLALDEHPMLWQRYGNLAKQAQAAWLALIGGQDLHMRECATRYAAHLSAELAGPGATPLEKLQAERIVALNLQVCYFEALLAQAAQKASHATIEFLDKRCGVANQRLQQALTSLAHIRRLLPRVLKVDVLVSGQIETTVKAADRAEAPPADDRATRIQVPANRIKDLLAAASN